MENHGQNSQLILTIILAIALSVLSHNSCHDCHNILCRVIIILENAEYDFYHTHGHNSHGVQQFYNMFFKILGWEHFSSAPANLMRFFHSLNILFYLQYINWFIITTSKLEAGDKSNKLQTIYFSYVYSLKKNRTHNEAIWIKQVKFPTPYH